jgi:hypothetical protein
MSAFALRLLHGSTKLVVLSLVIGLFLSGLILGSLAFNLASIFSKDEENGRETLKEDPTIVLSNE